MALHCNIMDALIFFKKNIIQGAQQINHDF
jgi:hypothetical protein